LTRRLTASAKAAAVRRSSQVAHAKGARYFGLLTAYL